jgi:tetratricopeptide (TPR) repeat protein
MSALPQALRQAALALQRGDRSEAERICRGILARDPAQFEALYFLGIAAGQAGRQPEALQWLSRAAQVRPGNPDAQFNLGVALGQAGRHADALAAYERALAIDPSRADAHYNRGVSLDALERTGEALAAYERAAAIQPRHAEAHHNRGVALTRLARAGEALAAFDAALAIDPRYAAAHNHRGVALAALERFEEALAAYGRALALAPRYAQAENHRAMALLDLDRPAEALESAGRALALAPDLADAWYHRGNALRSLGRHAEAAESFERAVAIEPAHASAHWNLADCRLLMGDFARGWEQFEWRWRLPARHQARREFREPQWTGAEPIAGRTLLLHAELGLGDTLQFCRFATEVARRGARVVLEAQAPLVPLLRTLEGVEVLVARGDPLPSFDLHCPLMSLPLALRTELATIPAHVPYLAGDPARVAAWRERLGPARGPRVGLAWSGSQGLRNDKRSATLAAVLPLARAGIEWVSLQKEVPAADAALLAAHPEIRDVSAALGDFAETAALAGLLDLVVTVDTSVAHVPGALGKPVWILLPHVPHDWRWLLDREDSVWYPTARLFRQPAPGDWASVVRRVDAELSRRFDV